MLKNYTSGGAGAVVIAQIDEVQAVIGALDDAAAAGAVTTSDTLMAYLKQTLNELLGTDGGWTNMDNAAVASLDVALQAIGKSIGIDSANQLSVAMDGSARTTVEAIATALASMIGARTNTAANAVITTSSVIALAKGVLASVAVGGGTFTTSSATVPADTGHGSKSNDYYNGCWLVPLSGAAVGEARRITDFATTSGIFTLDPDTPFSAASGTVEYLILHPSSSGLAPAVNGSGVLTLEQTIGNKADTVAAGAVTGTDTIIAYLKQIITQGMHDFTWWSKDASAIVVVPAAGADLDFPSVVIANLPAGATVVWAELIVVIGGTFDTSAAENQIKTASDELRVKLAAGAWGTDDVQAWVVPVNALQTGADAYGNGGVFWGGIDIKSEVTGNGTYNVRSEETNATKGIEATGATLELLNVNCGIRLVWY